MKIAVVIDIRAIVKNLSMVPEFVSLCRVFEGFALYAYDHIHKVHKSYKLVILYDASINAYVALYPVYTKHET